MSDWSYEQRMLERYFALRNKQIELLNSASGDMARVDALNEEANSVLEKADALLENVQMFSDMGSDAEVSLIESGDWLGHELKKPVRVDTTVKKLLKAAGIPDLAKLEDALKEYVELYNEQVEVLNRVTKVSAEAFALYEQADALVDEADALVDDQAIAEALERLELEVLIDSQIEEYLEGQAPKLKPTDPRTTAERVLAAIEPDDEPDDEEE